MKANNSRRSARVSSKKVTMTNTAKGLTSQAGLLLVVKFLRHNGVVSLIKDTIEHERGNNALYETYGVASLSLTKRLICQKSLFLLNRPQTNCHKYSSDMRQNPTT
jgi:hypothetical protein